MCDFITQNGSVKELSLIVLCGDFNIQRDPLNNFMATYLTKRDAEWANFIPNIDREYNEAISTLKGEFPTCFNVWDNCRRDEKCITYGKC